MMIRGTRNETLLGKCQVLFLNGKDLKLGKNIYLLVPRFDHTLYRHLRCKLVTGTTVDAVAWAFISGLRSQVGSADNYPYFLYK